MNSEMEDMDRHASGACVLENKAPLELAFTGSDLFGALFDLFGAALSFGERRGVERFVLVETARGFGVAPVNLEDRVGVSVSWLIAPGQPCEVTLVKDSRRSVELDIAGTRYWATKRHADRARELLAAQVGR